MVDTKKKKSERIQKWFRIHPKFYKRVKDLAGKSGRTIGGMLEIIIGEYKVK